MRPAPSPTGFDGARSLGWAQEHGLSVSDNLTYIREFGHVTLARVLLARYATDGDKAALDQVNGLLERLVSAVGAGARTGSVIEIRVLQALTHHAAGDGTGALLPLEQALTLAEPEGSFACSSVRDDRWRPC